MIDNSDINKIVMSNKISFGEKAFKYFMAIKMLKKLDLYAYSFQKWVHIEEITQCMSFLIKDEKSLEKYNEIWKKVNNIIKKEFDSKPLYNEKYPKTKTKSYNWKINTNFHNNKIPKEGSQCT